MLIILWQFKDMENFADLYTDYLITSTSYTTAMGMGLAVVD